MFTLALVVTARAGVDVLTTSRRGTPPRVRGVTARARIAPLVDIITQIEIDRSTPCGAARRILSRQSRRRGPSERTSDESGRARTIERLLAMDAPRETWDSDDDDRRRRGVFARAAIPKPYYP